VRTRAVLKLLTRSSKQEKALQLRLGISRASSKQLKLAEEYSENTKAGTRNLRQEDGRALPIAAARTTTRLNFGTTLSDSATWELRMAPNVRREPNATKCRACCELFNVLMSRYSSA
jgi:hypothetical protein